MARPVKMKIGDRFGRLTVLSRAPDLVKTQTRWLCRCDCGTEKVIYATHLRSQTVSCGCYAREQASKRQSTHGLTENIAHRSWSQMRTRCANPKDPSYEYYGARGIKVCQRWADFTLFLQDMGERPSLLYSLDRHPNTNGNYEPGNCRWATHKEQMRNRRNTVRLTFAGETLPVSQWAERIGKPNKTLLQRIKLGWTPAQVIEIEPR